ncbi:MAG: DNA internalization-related competence protein ComEC/Rec2 [Rhodocyclaceae bacterium]|nr:MAG: DNA internalization-related competence protein ComEC/Rec2 [Rhodocyclaceae bacterium]
MTLGILSFALGVLWLQCQATLPSWLCLWGAGLAACLLLVPRLPWRASRRVLAAALLGLAWAGMQAQGRLADALPEGSEGRDVVVTGVVSAMPQHFENGWRFQFDVEQATLPVPRRISLAWYQSLQLDEDGLSIPLLPIHAGERWRLTVRLKKPHGNLNPHGFDFEGWLLEQGVRATGYVRPHGQPERLEAFVATPGTLVEALRERIRSRFEAVLGERESAPILVALAVGDQRGISQEQWQVFSRTGLTHLFSVSGLHITMVAGLAYALVNLLWRRSSRLPLRLPAQHAAAIGGMAAALGYCLLAGFAVPAQRTLYMLTVVGLAQLSRRTIATHQVLAAALGVVLVLDPWAVLAAGFWLSFGAVALLFYIGAARIGQTEGVAGALGNWGRAQWAMTVGMVPLMLALFQQFSLVSPLANGVAIPLVSFVVTPLALLSALPGLDVLLLPAAWLTERLLDGCRWLAATPWAVWQQADPPGWALATGILGTFWLLAPRGFPARWVGAVLFLPLFFLPPGRPLPGAARIVVLDVGQGLAVHIQTAHHDLVFDSGPLFSPDANSGNRIIVPYLRAVGVTRLDGLVVSHADKDHSGGAASVLETVPTGWLLHALPAHHFLLDEPVQHLPCFDGQAWEWDGVKLSVLHPRYERHADPTRKTNDMSCVLKLETAQASALIPSDIEALSETELLARHREQLRADVLVVPHHGSRTSSTEAFVAAVSPRIAVFPVGYRNRFGHPKEDVVARYDNGATRLLRTDRDGALTLDFTGEGIRVQEEREERQRYWLGR